MKIFQREQDMQAWLSEQFRKKKALAEMIVNFDHFENKELLEKEQDRGIFRILSSFQHCLASFAINELITENVDISLNSKDILRPDFLLYAPDSQSVVIIELKNLKSASRQAGTELGAYAAEIRTYLPFFAEGDIVNVLISSEWPTLLRHYVYNEIVWLNRNLICLEPLQTADGVALRIIDPKKMFLNEVIPQIWSKQLGGYQLCLYDDKLSSNENADYWRTEQYEPAMYTALHAMSAKGNALKAHGFAFLWRNCFKVGLSPYNITVVNFASFQAQKLVYKDPLVSKSVLGKKILKIIKNHNPEGHGETLDAIVDYGRKFLVDFCTPRAEGYEDWEYLKPYIFNRTDALAFVGWGLFQDYYFDKLMNQLEDPESGHRPNATDPLFAIQLLNEIIYNQ